LFSCEEANFPASPPQNQRSEPQQLEITTMADNCGDSGRRPRAPAPHQPIRKNTKRTGELSEAAFLHKAQSLGFKVCKPWGDSERYDFILDNGQRLWRVQVKCTEHLRANGYDIGSIYVNRKGEKTSYTAAEIDVLIAHVVPVDVWYVLPVEAFATAKSLRLYPDAAGPRARFEQFREAWRLLRS
jgi:hypothetical protein